MDVVRNYYTDWDQQCKGRKAPRQTNSSCEEGPTKRMRCMGSVQAVELDNFTRHPSVNGATIDEAMTRAAQAQCDQQPFYHLATSHVQIQEPFYDVGPTSENESHGHTIEYQDPPSDFRVPWPSACLLPVDKNLASLASACQGATGAACAATSYFGNMTAVPSYMSHDALHYAYQWAHYSTENRQSNHSLRPASDGPKCHTKCNEASALGETTHASRMCSETSTVDYSFSTQLKAKAEDTATARHDSFDSGHSTPDTLRIASSDLCKDCNGGADDDRSSPTDTCASTSASASNACNMHTMSVCDIEDFVGHFIVENDDFAG